MTRQLKRFWIVACLLCLLAAWPALAAEPAGEKAKPAGDEAQPPAEKPDPFVVPDGTAEELLEYISGTLRSAAQGGMTLEKFTKMNTAMLEASEKILAAKPDDDQYKQAVSYKFQALSNMMRVRDPDALTKMQAFVDELTKAGKADLARDGQRVLLGAGASQIQPDQPEQMKEYLAEVQKFISAAPMQRADLSLAMSVASAFSSAGNNELAAEAYRTFAKVAATSEDEVVAKYAKRMDGAARRTELAGKPMEIEGVTMDGAEFNWPEFQKGKVVLIDFWATWCGWCIKEIPEMKTKYAAYHDRGFEIVGVCGDDTREPLDKFLSETEIPWTILYGKEGPSATIEHYGIMGWPTMLLVGRDGKVVSLNARGPKLTELLEQLIGPEEIAAEGEKAGGDAAKAKPKEGDSDG